MESERLRGLLQGARPTLEKTVTIPPLNESPPPRKLADRLGKLLKKIQAADRKALLATSSVEAFATFTPPILDHAILDRIAPGISQRRYEDIPEDIRTKASVRHLEFKAGWTGAHSDDLLDRLSRALLVVRNNLAHGEKTPFGLDKERARRNRDVSKVVLRVLKDILDFVLDRPSQKLVAYGTLRPGQPNHGVLAVDGTWRPVTLRGVISDEDGLPAFTYAKDAVAEAELFESRDLPGRWQRLDEWEGSRYERQLGLYRDNGLVGVANVYMTRSDEGDADWA